MADARKGRLFLRNRFASACSATARLLSSLLVVASAAATAASADLPPDFARLAERGEIRIGYQASAFPFAYLPRSDRGSVPPDAAGGRYIGYSVDLCKLVVARIDTTLQRDGALSAPLRVVPVQVKSRTRIPHLLAGDIDLECGSTTASAARRALAVDFSSTIFFSDIAVAVPVDSMLHDVADLRVKRDPPLTLMTVSGTTSVAHVAAFLARGDAQIEAVNADDLGDGFERFSSTRRADAFVLDRILLRSHLAPERFRLLAGQFPARPESYALMLRAGDLALKSAVDEALACAAIDGSFRRIYRRWFIDKVPREQKQPGPDVALGIAMPNELSAQLETLALGRCTR